MTYLTQIKPHIATRTCSMALALTALAGGIALSPGTAAADIGDIHITTRNNTTEKVTQNFRPGNGNKNVVRVCLHNKTAGQRSLRHTAQRINNLETAAGTTSCANFPSDYNGGFKAFAGGSQVRNPSTLNLITTAMGGGVLNVFWGTPPPQSAQPGNDEYMITTRNNTREKMVQRFFTDQVAPQHFRICLINKTGGERMLTHKFGPTINPLRAASGSRTCANFPAISQVEFEVYTGDTRVHVDKVLRWPANSGSGGRMDLVWGG
jgi:hypothetical protein